MKILTVKQPYASLISHNLKIYEFRNFCTKYRGPLYIHAAKTPDYQALERVKDIIPAFPISVIVAKVNLVDCVLVTEELIARLNKLNPSIYCDISGNYKYAWVLQDIQLINSSTIIKGQLGIWNYQLDEGDKNETK